MAKLSTTLQKAALWLDKQPACLVLGTCGALYMMTHQSGLPDYHRARNYFKDLFAPVKGTAGAFYMGRDKTLKGEELKAFRVQALLFAAAVAKATNR